MIDLKDYVVLWSPKEKEFHIEPIESMLEANLNIFMKVYDEKYKTDYIVLAFAESFEQGLQIREKLEKI